MTQRTLVLLKPDAVRRGLIGNVISRFEAKGLSIVAMELRTIDEAKADEHYAEHVERDFYPPLRAFVTSGPLVAMVLEGDEAVEGRALLGRRGGAGRQQEGAAEREQGGRDATGIHVGTAPGSPRGSPG